MAGDYVGPGHKIVTGEVPVVGLLVLTNELRWGRIVKVADEAGHKTCGYYCEAWHEVEYPAQDSDPSTGEAAQPRRTVSMNCDRLATRTAPGSFMTAPPVPECLLPKAVPAPVPQPVARRRSHLSRMIACDQCGEGMPDRDMRQVYHLEDDREVTDGLVHSACEEAFRLTLP